MGIDADLSINVRADTDVIWGLLVDPSADLRAGYNLQMPTNSLSESEVADVIAYIKDLSPGSGDG